MDNEIATIKEERISDVTSRLFELVDEIKSTLGLPLIGEDEKIDAPKSSNVTMLQRDALKVVEKNLKVILQTVRIL